MRYGGALSHHHGVGYEHARWMVQEDGQAGVAALRAVKRALDPQHIMNPAKLFEEA
jgi:alkyldihydroxyacetonephosphate synthase